VSRAATSAAWADKPVKSRTDLRCHSTLSNWPGPKEPTDVRSWFWTGGTLLAPFSAASMRSIAALPCASSIGWIPLDRNEGETGDGLGLRVGYHGAAQALEQALASTATSATG
jgi:hypothetical protein